MAGVVMACTLQHPDRDVDGHESAAMRAALRAGTMRTDHVLHPGDSMAALLPDVDPDGLLEYSVVYTDRALNHMSKRFQGVMRDVSAILKQVYRARSAIVVPGSGTFGMEAVARQFAQGKRCLVVRNGWFSYRWTQIFEMGRI